VELQAGPVGDEATAADTFTLQIHHLIPELGNAVVMPSQSTPVLVG
jgi:hypothetical protein